jgi:hypothetical protein
VGADPVLLIEPPPPREALDLGVIRKARRRRRRRLARAAAAATGALLVVAAGVLGLAAPSKAPPTPALRRSSSPTRLSGPPLRAATDLRLIVDADGGRPYILDVDHDTVRPLSGLGVGVRVTEWSPSAAISPIPGGALAIVSRQACKRCARSQALFAVAAGGSIRRVATVSLGSDNTTATLPDPGAAGEWVDSPSRGGGCTLRLVPSGDRGVNVPCGYLDLETGGRIAISTSRGLAIVNPRTGRVLERFSSSAQTTGQVDPLPGNLALESSTAFPNATKLALVNLATGARTPLRWPSAIPRYGYRAVAEPGGPLVAVIFIDPYYQPSGAPLIDTWVLDTRTDRFAHVPGFPAAEDFKQSGVAWAAGGRLVIAAEIEPQNGRAAAVVGIWKPGQTTLPLRTVPASASGYYSFVPVFG